MKIKMSVVFLTALLAGGAPGSAGAAVEKCQGYVAEVFYWGEFGKRTELYFASSSIKDGSPNFLDLGLMDGKKTVARQRYVVSKLEAEKTQAGCWNIRYSSDGGLPNTRFPPSLSGYYCKNKLQLSDEIDTGPMSVQGTRRLINHLDCE